jgi:hypothetical protein
MLHPLNPLPPELEDKLLKLIDRQRELLLFAVNHGAFDDDVLRESLGDRFTEWLHIDKYTGVLIYLEQLVGSPQADKESVLRDFDHDQEFWLGDDPSFQFAFDPNSTDAHKAAKGCLNPFFEEFFGFDLLLTNGTGFRKRDIYDGYVLTNSTVDRVCGFCDGSMKRDRPKRQGRDYTLEHFFHKESHPSISMHPYNLVPCCEVCNKERGNREALEVDGRVLTLGEIFHPLLRPARENVELRYYSQGLEPEELEFIRIDREEWESAITVYSELYRIPERWLELWADIDGVVGGRLRALIDLHRNSQGAGITPIAFEQMVHSVLRSLQDYTARYEYPAHYWLMWARNDRRRLKMLYQSHVVTRGLNAPGAW